MGTIAKLLGFPQEIYVYIGFLYLQECFSEEQCYKYHTSILRKECLTNINIIFPTDMSVHTMIRKTLYKRIETQKCRVCGAFLKRTQQISGFTKWQKNFFSKTFITRKSSNLKCSSSCYMLRKSKKFFSFC